MGKPRAPSHVAIAVAKLVDGHRRETLRRAAAQTAAGAGEQPNDGAAFEPREPPAPPVCHVGLVFALGIEAGGLVDRLAGVVRVDGAGFVGAKAACTASAGRRRKRRRRRGRRARHRRVIYGHHPRWIISAGFAGALDDRLGKATS